MKSTGQKETLLFTVNSIRVTLVDLLNLLTLGLLAVAPIGMEQKVTGHKAPQFTSF